MEVILGHLEKGTMDCIKMAQIDLTKLMSPILHRIPDEALKFISTGGKPETLKTLFTNVKEKK